MNLEGVVTNLKTCLKMCVLVSCSVTSSEKVDKAQRYADFTLLSVPYPGKGVSLILRGAFVKGHVITVIRRAQTPLQ